MSSTFEETLLRKAITTMLSQICKVGVVYAGELVIEGTLGVTVDRQKVILIHFDDRVVHADGGFSSGDPVGDGASLGSLYLATSDTADAEDCSRLFGAEALSNLLLASDSLNTGTRCGRKTLPIGDVDSSVLTGPSHCLDRNSGSESFKMMSCFQETASTNGDILADQTLNERIAIDVDSDSFDNLQLDDISNPINSVDDRSSFSVSSEQQVREGSRSNSSHYSRRMVACGVGRGKQLKRRARGKNVIVIDDKEGLFNNRANTAHAGTDVKSIRDGSGCSSLRDDELQTTEYENFCSSNGPTDSEIARFRITSPAPADKDDSMADTKRFCLSTGCRFTCDICAARLKTVSLLESHLIARHGIVEHAQLGRITHFACKHCAKRFRFQAQHDKHVVRHDMANLRLHQCRQCRNAYRRAGSLRLHTLSHDGVLTCDLCDKSYANRVLFQKHIVYKHEQEKT